MGTPSVYEGFYYPTTHRPPPTSYLIPPTCSAGLIGVSLSEPHINVKFVQLVCLSVFLSVRMFMTRKYTRIVVVYGVPLVVDSNVYGTFGELLCMPTFNKHVVTNNKNKQVLILRKQVYRSLIKIISLALLLLLKY